MPNVLALDLATLTGWASSVGGVRASGSVNFPVKPGEQRGWRFVRFNFWLYKREQQKLDLIAYEKPIPFHKSQLASEIAFGFVTRVHEFCARHGVRYEAVPNGTVKKWAGCGRNDKAAMVKAAQVLKRGITDHNEADALWLLEYAMGNLVARSQA